MKIEKIPYNRNLIALIFLIGTFVTVLNQTVLFTALPQIMRDFQINADTAQWLTTAYMMTNGILIPVTAFLIDKYTTRQLTICALSLFILGTTTAALAHSFTLLLIARIIQASGAGIILPLLQTVFFRIFPKEKRGITMGLVGLVTAFAPAIGPTFSGFILDNFSWRYIFLIVLPIAIIVLLLAFLYMKNVSEVDKTLRIDRASVVLSTLGFGALLYGVSIAGSGNNLSAIICFLTGAISLTIFIYRSLKMDRPMLEFRVFESSSFALSTIVVIISLICLMAPQNILPIYIQDIRGMSALNCGLLLLPGAIANGAVSIIAGKIYDKIGGKILGILGCAVIITGVVPFVFLNSGTMLWTIVLFYTIMLVGIAMIMMPMTIEGLNSLSNQLINHGTAMVNTFRQVGGSIGTALLITIYTKTSSYAFETGGFSNANEATVHGMNYAFIGAIIFAFIGLVVSSMLKSNNKKPADSTL